MVKRSPIMFLHIYIAVLTRPFSYQQHFPEQPYCASSPNQLLLLEERKSKRVLSHTPTAQLTPMSLDLVRLVPQQEISP